MSEDRKSVKSWLGQLMGQGRYICEGGNLIVGRPRWVLFNSPYFLCTKPSVCMYREPVHWNSVICNLNLQGSLGCVPTMRRRWNWKILMGEDMCKKNNPTQSSLTHHLNHCIIAADEIKKIPHFTYQMKVDKLVFCMYPATRTTHTCTQNICRGYFSHPIGGGSFSWPFYFTVDIPAITVKGVSHCHLLLESQNKRTNKKTEALKRGMSYLLTLVTKICCRCT